MSYYNDTNLGFPAEVFPSYTPDNSQSYYLPSTVQENITNYELPNSFGYFHQDYVPENSYRYFDNGYQSTESENEVIYHPVISQVYVPETHLYKVVHAVVFHGTTYFYESLVDYPVYRLYNTITYSPAYIVDGNSSCTNWPGENSHTNDVDEYIETTPENDYHSNALELLSTQSNNCLSPSTSMNTFNSPEMVLNSCSYNNYWNAAFIQSECDIVENDHENTSVAIVEENVTLCAEVFENCYTEDIVTRNESNIYYEQANYGWPHLRDDFSLGEGSIQEPMQSPVLPLVALDKNGIKSQVKFKKDSIYLTALSGKLYQKKSIPVVEKMPVIVEIEGDYPTIECSNNTIENLSQNKPVVQAHIYTKYSKKVCRIKSIRVVESLTDFENSNHEDHVIDRSIGFFSKTMQRIDSAVRENIFTNQCTKTYRKESCLFVENVHLIKEISDNCKVRETSKVNFPKMERTYSVLEENMFTKRTEKLIRKERKKDFREMPVIQEVADEDPLVQSNNGYIPKIRQSVLQTNTFTGRSKKLYKKERSEVFEKMPIIEEVDDEDHLAQSSTENVIKIKKSLAHKTKRDVIINKGDLRSFEIEELNLDTEKDHDGFLENNGNMEDNLLTQESGFQSKSTDIPQVENRNIGNLFYSVDVGKPSVITAERSSSDKCQEIQTNDNTELNAPVEYTAENTTFIPEKVGLEVETGASLENENEPTKVLSQKPKKKRFENLRKFFGRLLSCCSKGPT